MKQIEIPTQVKNGNFTQNRELIKKAVKEFEGKDVFFGIRRRSKKRSNQQNAFYWSVWIPILQNAFKDTQGEFYTEDETHEALKLACNYREVPNPETGEMTRFPISSTKLDTYEWEKEFKQKIRQLAMDFFNIDLPEPETEEELKNKIKNESRKKKSNSTI